MTDDERAFRAQTVQAINALFISQLALASFCLHLNAASEAAEERWADFMRRVDDYNERYRELVDRVGE